MTVALTLLGQRWLRSRGAVVCDLYWHNTRGAGSVDGPGGVEVQQRQLEVSFTNRKDVPVTVRSMQVVFYKGGKPLDAEERPEISYRGDGGGWRPFKMVGLPPHTPVSLAISVDPGHDEHVKQRAVEAADRVEFVANIDEAKDIRTDLALWDALTPQTKRLQSPWWHRRFGG